MLVLFQAQMLYPIMQCTDIFFLGADVCQLGVDQRKVNMLAREYCEAAGIKLKPIILSHHMLYGLLPGQVSHDQPWRYFSEIAEFFLFLIPYNSHLTS